MTNALLIGNSHSRMMIDGLARAKAPPAAFSLNHFAAPAPVINRCQHDDEGRFGVLDPSAFCDKSLAFVDAINGRRSVDLNAYDVVIYSCLIMPYRAASLLVAENAVDGLSEDNAGPRVSAPAFAAMLEHLTTSSPAFAFCGPLMATPAVVVAQPRPAQILAPDNPMRARLKFEPEAVRSALDAAEAVACSTCERAGARFVAQDRTTITPEGLTDPRYRVGAVDLVREAQRRDDDNIHMNAELGGLMWDALFHAIALPVPERRPTGA